MSPAHPICGQCRGQASVCSKTGRPWGNCDCGWCERGPNTRTDCPTCCDGVKAEIPISEKTPNEFCPDCEANGAFLARCFVGPHSWVCETCYNLRLEREHGRQAFWERSALAFIRHGFTTEETAGLADNLCAEWMQRFGK